MTTSNDNTYYFYFHIFSISLLNFTELYKPWGKKIPEIYDEPVLYFTCSSTRSGNNPCINKPQQAVSHRHTNEFLLATLWTNQALCSNVLINPTKFHFYVLLSGYGETAGAFQCRCTLFYLQCESQPSPLGPEPLLRRTWSVLFSGAWTGSMAGCLRDREHY